jgi:excisionase family DNA binding protein
VDAEKRAAIDKMSPMLTPKEAAKLLHVHENTIRRWSNRGLIRAYRITQRGDRRFRRDDLNRLFTKLE